MLWQKPTFLIGLTLYCISSGVDYDLFEELVVPEGEAEEAVEAVLELEQILDVRHGVRLLALLVSGLGKGG